VSFEFVDHINESVSNISFSTGPFTVFDLEGGSVVIGSIIIPLGGFGINSLGWVRLG